MKKPFLLDYREHIHAGSNQWGNSPEPGKGLFASLYNEELLFAIRGYCPYCATQAQIVYDTGNRDTVPSLEDGWFSPKVRVWAVRVWKCASCGWWEVETVDKEADDPHGDETSIDIYHASLRRFDVASLEVPVATLEDHIARNPELIRHVSPHKMERLVEAVFREHYDCEVVHCGRSHDGGVDLLLIDSKEPRAVQVKRRERLDRKESVMVVREFLGACLLAGFKRGVLVTTAKDFSPSAKQAAATAVTKSLVDAFELVNGDELVRRMGLASKEVREPWRRFLERPDWEWNKK